MTKRRATAQTDLFATPDTADAADTFVETDAYRALIRAELDRLMARVTGAQRLPWDNHTQAYVAYLQFQGYCGRLPEGPELLRRFVAELDRIDDILEAEAIAAAAKAG